MRIAVYTMTWNRLDYTKRAFTELRKKAGIEFKHYVADNGSTDGTAEWLAEELAAGRIHRLWAGGQNYGVNIAANVLLDLIEEDGADWVLRFDNDIVPSSRRFLKKMVKYASMASDEGIMFVCSPKVTKSNEKINRIGRATDLGTTVHGVEVLPGKCRLHPWAFFDSWRFNKYGALASGEANEVADRITKWQQTKGSAVLAELPAIKVEHYRGEAGQKADYPDYFAFDPWEVNRHVGFGL